MGASRVSNKDLLLEISAQTHAITQLAAAIAGAQPTHSTEPVATTAKAVETDTAKPADVKVPASYLEHQKVKAQEHANNKGERVILYFYPKHNTPGCTTEGEDFRDNFRRFRARDPYWYRQSSCR